MAAHDGPVILEVAISAPPRSPNPNAPLTPEQIGHDAVACFAAGASIVHSHGDLAAFGEDGAQVYRETWRTLFERRPDALVYPTVTIAPADGNRLTHVPSLVRSGHIRMTAYDPGSLNLSSEAEDGTPLPDEFVYVNNYRDIDHAFALMTELGIGASLAIYEPGFLRAVLAFHQAGKLPPGSMVKFYFGGPHNPRTRRRSPVTFGLPPTPTALDAYLEMLGGADIAWGVAVPGGDLLRTPVARRALELGGHLRVGLEDYAGEREPSNAELVREAVDLCHAVGRPVATFAETAAILGLPELTAVAQRGSSV